MSCDFLIQDPILAIFWHCNWNRYLFVFLDDEALCLASNYWRFNSTSGTRNCDVLPTDMSRNNTKRHGIFQELCNMSSSTSNSCHVELNSWLLSISSSSGPLKQGSSMLLSCYYLHLDNMTHVWTMNFMGYLTRGLFFYIGTESLWWETH